MKKKLPPFFYLFEFTYSIFFSKILSGRVLMFKFFKMLKSKDNWRNKATERNQKIKNLQKRVKDIEKSRNIWKEKATIYKEYNNELKDELKKN